MTQPLFIFELSNGSNEIIKLDVLSVTLKNILNGDSFKEYVNPVVFI